MLVSDAIILIVDDNRTSRQKMSLAVKSLGHTAVTAENGSIGLQKLSQQQFDLVLLDIEMPVMDGFGVLARMRENKELFEIPVIVISASSEMENIVKAIELGAQDFLPKNFEKILFRARVHACIERKKLSDQRKEHLAQINKEKNRADDLLRSTLPAAAIEELKRTNAVIPRRHENVVVLMADVVSFTQFCDNNPPEEAVSRLHNLVDGFEKIASDHELEKIKTIGDAFMATASLLHIVTDPVEAAVNCALKMTTMAPQLAQGWEVRVGIHYGPVVAGVIGHQQHLYDLWGDTVNIAARITAIAQPSAVCFSESVANNLADMGQKVETVQVKGKGSINVYHLASSGR